MKSGKERGLATPAVTQCLDININLKILSAAVAKNNTSLGFVVVYLQDS